MDRGAGERLGTSSTRRRKGHNEHHDLVPVKAESLARVHSLVCRWADPCRAVTGRLGARGPVLHGIERAHERRRVAPTLLGLSNAHLGVLPKDLIFILELLHLFLAVRLELGAEARILFSTAVSLFEAVAQNLGIGIALLASLFLLGSGKGAVGLDELFQLVERGLTLFLGLLQLALHLDLAVLHNRSTLSLEAGLLGGFLLGLALELLLGSACDAFVKIVLGILVLAVERGAHVFAVLLHVAEALQLLALAKRVELIASLCMTPDLLFVICRGLGLLGDELLAVGNLALHLCKQLQRSLALHLLGQRLLLFVLFRVLDELELLCSGILALALALLAAHLGLCLLLLAERGCILTLRAGLLLLLGNGGYPLLLLDAEVLEVAILEHLCAASLVLHLALALADHL
eukprot:m.11309 g.11309  ORF g.11309 m.11309 type:complete len:404 (+) comp3146_c0_seq1:216-1427(+)